MARRSEDVAAPRVSGGEGYWDIILPFAPVPASRPKVSRWGTYYTKNYEEYRWRAKACLAQIGTGLTIVAQQELFVLASFVLTKPPTGKKKWPRGDGDNYEKGLYDAITTSGLVWADDDQIIVGKWHKRYADEDEEAHTFIRIATSLDKLPDDLLFTTPRVGDDVYDG